MKTNQLTNNEIEYLKNLLDQQEGEEDASLADSIYGKLNDSAETDADPNQIAMEYDGHSMIVPYFHDGYCQQ